MQLKLHFDLSEPLAEFQNVDARPTDTMPSIKMVDGQRFTSYARWGLIPYWAKDAKEGTRNINARAETIDEKPSFRGSFRRRRCIVPASAFFQWITVPGEEQKRKLRFSSPNGEPLAIAGLWDSWKKPGTEENIESFTMITTEPNAMMMPFHDRMPAILPPEHHDAWLRPDTPPDVAKSMLQPAAEEALVWQEKP